MRLEVLKAMNAARRERRAGAIVTRLSDGDQRFVEADSVSADPLAAELEAALRSGKSGAATVDGGRHLAAQIRGHALQAVGRLGAVPGHSQLGGPFVHATLQTGVQLPDRLFRLPSLGDVPGNHHHLGHAALALSDHAAL